jgi:hypothetical protein
MSAALSFQKLALTDLANTRDQRAIETIDKTKNYLHLKDLLELS